MAATKVTAKSKAKVDLIESTVTEVENLTAESAVAEAHNLIEGAEFNYFKLGGVLAVIQENGWWSESGHENFKTFIEAEMGLPYRKAMYLIEIYQSLVEAEIPWDTVKDVGWTKLKEIAKLLTQENADEWVQRANEMTTIQLVEYIKASQQSETAEEGDEETTKATKVSTMTFKVHEDQKETIRTALDKAKEEAGTEYDTVALEGICIQYMEGTLGKKTKGKAPSMKDLMAKAGVEEVLEVFEECFPNVDLTVEMPEEA